MSIVYEGIDIVGGLSFDAAGKYALGGSTQSSIDLGGGKLPFAGGRTDRDSDHGEVFPGRADDRG